MKKLKAGGGWPAVFVHLEESPRGRRHPQALAGDALEERLQDLRARHGRAARRHGQRAGPLPRSLQEESAGDGRRHAGRHPQRLLAAVFGARAAATFAARAGSLRPARRAGALHARNRPLHADLVGRSTRTHRDEASRDAARRNVLVLQRPQQQRSRLPAATLRPAVRHEQRQQLQLLLPPGERRRPGERHRQRHGDDRARRSGARRLRVRHRRQPGQQPSAADAHAAARSPPRRASHRHQPDRRNGPGAIQRAERHQEPAVRQPRSPASTCSRTSAATWRCSPASPSASSRWARTTKRFSTTTAKAGRNSKRGLRAVSWDEIIAKSGVTRDEIDEIADRYAAAKNVVFSWTMGITHHAHGVKNVQAIGNLALLRGMVGRPGCGLMPIRGHSNVQGIGSVGVTPKLKDAIFDRLQSHFGVKLPTTPGRDTMACIEGAAAGELKVGFCLGGNLYGSNPDATFAAKSLAQPRPDRLPQHDAQHGPRPRPRPRDDHPSGARPRRRAAADHAGVDVQLHPPQRRRPATARRPAQRNRRHRVASPNASHDRQPPARRGFVNGRTKSNGHEAIPGRAAGCRHRLVAMRSTAQIRKAIAQIVPGFEQMADIDRTKQEFQIGGRTFHTPQFATPDGRARLHVHELPDSPAPAPTKSAS